MAGIKIIKISGLNEILYRIFQAKTVEKQKSLHISESGHNKLTNAICIHHGFMSDIFTRDDWFRQLYDFYFSGPSKVSDLEILLAILENTGNAQIMKIFCHHFLPNENEKSELYREEIETFKLMAKKTILALVTREEEIEKFEGKLSKNHIIGLIKLLDYLELHIQEDVFKNNFHHFFSIKKFVDSAKEYGLSDNFNRRRNDFLRNKIVPKIIDGENNVENLFIFIEDLLCRDPSGWISDYIDWLEGAILEKRESQVETRDKAEKLIRDIDEKITKVGELRMKVMEKLRKKLG